MTAAAIVSVLSVREREAGSMGEYRQAIIAGLLFAGVYFVAEAAVKMAMHEHLESTHGLASSLGPVVYIQWILGTCVLVYVGMAIGGRRRIKSQA